MVVTCTKRSPHPDGSKPCVFYIQDKVGAPGFCSKPDEFRCVESIKHYAPKLSHSAAMDWMRCKRKYWLGNVKGIIQIPGMMDGPLKLGSIWDPVMGRCFESGEVVKLDLMDIVSKGEKYDKNAGKMVNVNLDEMQKAKLYALVRALVSLEFKPVKGMVQAEVSACTVSDPPVNFHGFVDVGFKDMFVECKLSGRPDWYEDPWNLQDQIGSYFWAKPEWTKAIMMVTRVPDLKKPRKGPEESAEEFEERCYQDIISRPTHYFPGWNRDTHRWGKVYYRTEFDLDGVGKRLKAIVREIRAAACDEGGFYPEHGGCLFPGQCEYLDICKTGVLSESKYMMRVKPEGKEEKQ